MWQKLKLKKPNIVTNVISEPNVTTMVETHFQINIVAIEVDNQMVVIQVQVRKNIVEDVFLDGGASVNIITKNLWTELGLPKLRPTPYHFKMVDQSTTKSLQIIKNLKIHIHGIPYVTMFIVLQNNVVHFSYSMLLGRPWFKDAKVKHD
jgi:hypothetical protein